MGAILKLNAANLGRHMLLAAGHKQAAGMHFDGGDSGSFDVVTHHMHCM
jgi:hypothetical protein